MFLNRQEAGQVLAQKIKENDPHLVKNSQVIVLGVARGGVVVAAEVSKVLKCPLDVVIVRKLGVSGHAEFGFGAVDLDGRMVLDEGTVKSLGLTTGTIESVRQKEFREAQRRGELYWNGRGQLNLKNKIVILVDDGLATGLTTQAAVNYVRHHQPQKIILAVPVAPVETVDKIRPLVDELIVLETPANFLAVGQFYQNFPQTNDEEVLRLFG